MTQLNDEARLFEIKVVNAHTFTIGDTASFAPYESGGVATEVKRTLQMSFVRIPLRWKQHL